MLHVHILSWVLAIILFIATYLNYSKTQGASPYHRPLHMALRLLMLLTLVSGFWELIGEFMAAPNDEGGSHMLLTLKMLCGLAAIAFIETSIAKRKKQQTGHKFFWIIIALIIIAMVISVILPWSPISKILGVSQKCLDTVTYGLYLLKYEHHIIPK